MSATTTDRAATVVGLVTLAIGVGLTAAPAGTARALRLGDHTRLARGVGIIDLALAPGLLRGRSRWQWLAARTALNALLALHYRREAQGARAAGMVALTVVDGTLAAVSRPHGHHR